MLSDIEIAQSAKIKPIAEVAEQAGIDPDKLEMYGKYKAKLPLDYIQNLPERPDAKLILVTAMNPTPAGEGKTTVSIGLAQGLKLIGKKPILALREPSLGPVFGVKGGACGGGYSQVVPQTTFLQLLSTTTYSRATASISIRTGSYGRDVST